MSVSLLDYVFSVSVGFSGGVMAAWAYSEFRCVAPIPSSDSAQQAPFHKPKSRQHFDQSDLSNSCRLNHALHVRMNSRSRDSQATGAGCRRSHVSCDNSDSKAKIWPKRSVNFSNRTLFNTGWNDVYFSSKNSTAAPLVDSYTSSSSEDEELPETPSNQPPSSEPPSLTAIPTELLLSFYLGCHPNPWDKLNENLAQLRRFCTPEQKKGLWDDYQRSLNESIKSADENEIPTFILRRLSVLHINKAYSRATGFFSGRSETLTMFNISPKSALNKIANALPKMISNRYVDTFTMMNYQVYTASGKMLDIVLHVTIKRDVFGLFMFFILRGIFHHEEGKEGEVAAYDREGKLVDLDEIKTLVHKYNAIDIICSQYGCSVHSSIKMWNNGSWGKRAHPKFISTFMTPFQCSNGSKENSPIFRSGRKSSGRHINCGNQYLRMATQTQSFNPVRLRQRIACAGCRKSHVSCDTCKRVSLCWGEHAGLSLVLESKDVDCNVRRSDGPYMQDPSSDSSEEMMDELFLGWESIRTQLGESPAMKSPTVTSPSTSTATLFSSSMNAFNMAPVPDRYDGPSYKEQSVTSKTSDGNNSSMSEPPSLAAYDTYISLRFKNMVGIGIEEEWKEISKTMSQLRDFCTPEQKKGLWDDYQNSLNESIKSADEIQIPTVIWRRHLILYINKAYSQTTGFPQGDPSESLTIFQMAPKSSIALITKAIPKIIMRTHIERFTIMNWETYHANGSTSFMALHVTAKRDVFGQLKYFVGHGISHHAPVEQCGLVAYDDRGRTVDLGEIGEIISIQRRG
ncbi:hypothetical protein PROFUN_07397 [Planoprotostelium fungivorum]|uniref:Uncharacterized protein n=1 Tax=Planoprotostelium fungivorum TaxID=1890364 RepID=A0A2P6MTK5_9EUKA|nr:hypothetical protein PROFUN_07397 [Planoprotostelium fungivorum]